MKTDIYTEVTNIIVSALEDSASLGKFQLPWHSEKLHAPRNVTTGNRYQGMNVVLLMVANFKHGFSRPTWGTFKQWGSVGAKIRRGEKASLCLFWGKAEKKNEKTGELEEYYFPKRYHVFNVAQVEGYAESAPVEADLLTRLSKADEYFEAIPANVRHGLYDAHYNFVTDEICLPEFHHFKNPESYYSTRAHETIHWTGHGSRLKRTFGDTFGSDSYAMEELVAELGAAFLCADLEISTTPRIDHAQYLNYWLKILKADSRAIFKASSAARAAVGYLNGLAAGKATFDLEQVA